MGNYYFTFWIDRHGREAFTELVNKVASNTYMPKALKGKIDKDEYVFHYFWVVYCIVTLNYFGLNKDQISFYMDLSMPTGTNKLFSPSEVLEVQKDVIPDIVKYIKRDFELYQEN